MVIIGIDPGQLGAVAVLDTDGTVLWVQPTPLTGKEHDLPAMRRLLNGWADARVYLEDPGRVVRTPGGVRPATVLRESVCLWRGLCSGLHLPVRLVSPAAWQRRMHAGTPADEPRKVRSVLAARQRWADVTLRRTPRSRTDCDGMAEALLLAEYGRAEVLGREVTP